MRWYKEMLEKKKRIHVYHFEKATAKALNYPQMKKTLNSGEPSQEWLPY